MISDVSGERTGFIFKSQGVLEDDIFPGLLDPDLKISGVVWNPKSHPI